MLIVDFDYTLNRTGLFKEEIRKVFASFGVDEQTFESSYHKSIQWDGEGYGFDYSFEIHIEVLKEMGIDINSDDILSKFDETIKKSYLFDDAIPFLNYFRSKGEKIVLLSSGNVEFQKKKVDASGIAELVDEVKLSHGNKEKYIEKVIDQKPLYFINDNLKENNIIHELFPDVIILGMKNGFKHETEDRGEDILYFDSLTEIMEYVKKL